MRTSRLLGRSLLVSLIFFVAHFAWAADVASPPAAAFGTLPRTAYVDLSPDGKTVAWLDAGATPERIIVFDLVTYKDKRKFTVPADTKLRSLSWADNEILLFTASATRVTPGDNWDKYEMFRTFAADMDSGAIRMLLMGDGDRQYVQGAHLVAWHTTKPKTVIMWTWDYTQTAARMETGSRLAGHREDSGWVAMLFEVDTRTGKGTRIDEGTQFTNDWVVDAGGNSVARSEWNPKSNVYSVLAKRGLGWREIYRRQDGSQLELRGLTSDKAALVAIGADKDGRSKLWALPLDGSEAKVLVQDPERDVTGIVQDRFTDTPNGAVLSGIEPEIRWLDAQSGKRQSALEPSFPGHRVRIFGRTEDNTRVLARVSDAATPAIYYLVDYHTHKADIVGEEYPDLADVKLGNVRAFTYKARDGTEIPAYLTTPAGSAGKTLPLVVMPHGGPEGRDDFGFDWLAQFLATRGYAVLQPQFRGSIGFGDAFRKAGYHQWGGLMQDDVTDGVKNLIDQHLADPRRICIVGGSYGGYAALAGVAFTPELYSCAVSVNGVSDLPRMLAYEEEHHGKESNTVAYWRMNIGSPSDPKIVAASPSRAAARITAPVLLIHSADDTIVPEDQSEVMFRALHVGGKPVTLIKLPGDDHWLSRTETRIRVLKEIETFLQAHL